MLPPTFLSSKAQPHPRLVPTCAPRWTCRAWEHLSPPSVVSAVGTTTPGRCQQRAERDRHAFKLGQTNVITTAFLGSAITANFAVPTNSIDVGSDNGNAGGVDFLFLGQTNAFFIDSIGVGMCKAIGTMLFNPGFSSPTAYFSRHQRPRQPHSLLDDWRHVQFRQFQRQLQWHE